MACGVWRVWVRIGGVCRVLVGKPEEKRPLGRPRRRWVDNKYTKSPFKVNRWPTPNFETIFPKNKGVCRVLVGKPEGRRPLGRPRRRWVDNKYTKSLFKVNRWPTPNFETIFPRNRGVCRVLVGKPEGRRLLGRPRRRWVDNIRISRKWDVGIGTGLGWARIETGGGRLWVL